MDQNSSRFEFYQKIGKNNVVTLSSVVLGFCMLYAFFLVNPTYHCNLKIISDTKSTTSPIISNLADELTEEFKNQTFNANLNTTLNNSNQTTNQTTIHTQNNTAEQPDQNQLNNQNQQTNTTVEQNQNNENNKNETLTNISDENLSDNQTSTEQQNTEQSENQQQSEQPQNNQSESSTENQQQNETNAEQNMNNISDENNNTENQNQNNNNSQLNSENLQENQENAQNETSNTNTTTSTSETNSQQNNETSTATNTTASNTSTTEQNQQQENQTSTESQEQQNNTNSQSNSNNNSDNQDNNAIFYKKWFEIPEDVFKYQMGMTFVDDRYCPHVPFGSARGLYALRQMHAAGVNWVAIVVTEYQQASDSVDIHPVYEPIKLDYYIHNTATIDNLTRVINAAHELGMRVMLKPHIDLYVDRSSGLWRGNIYQSGQQSVQDWFESYTAMVVKYATLAEALDVELFSIQCELQGMNGWQEQWRQVIKEIRYVYKGKLLSAANYGGQETGTQFWDDLDYIGVDAYYFGWQINNGDADSLKNRWNQPFSSLKQLSQQFKKPVLISELGYCSGSCGGTLASPVQNGGLENQALQFETLLQKIEENTDWLQGIYWWSWFTDPRLGGSQDGCITPHDKPAEEILRKYYHSDRPLLPTPDEYEQLCECRL